jgi:hypothetical protein
MNFVFCFFVQTEPLFFFLYTLYSFFIFVSSLYQYYLSITYAIHLKILKWLIDGLTLLHASCGVMFFTARVGLRLSTWTLQLTASGKKVFGIFFFTNMFRTMFIIVWFFLSATSFCCGVYETVSCMHIPCNSQKLAKLCGLNSPPWLYKGSEYTCQILFQHEP